MGEVWLALRSDGRYEGRSYAPSPGALDRFRREGRILARLVQPHIARLVDAGVTDAGQPYLVLDYVAGERIDECCESHDLTPVERVRLLLDVLGALAHAHRNLVTHRDIKPSNILVTAESPVKLLDFGIAKLLSAEPGSADESPPTRIEELDSGSGFRAKVR
jgi:eukaryotic-like serine/threonine-protein kinase